MSFHGMFTRGLVAALLLCLGSQVFAARTTTYLHNDGLGSVVAATNQAGAVLWRKDYAPFGEQIDSTPDSERTAYTGKQHDDAIGLTYFGGRHFDPELGRFTSVDPVAFTEQNAMSFNRYLYVNNNPYKYVDPDGEFLNFAAKFVLDVGVNMAINYLTTGELNVSGALKDSAIGLLNPAKTTAGIGKLGMVLSKGGKVTPDAGSIASATSKATKPGRVKNHHREAPDADGRPHTSYRTDAEGRVTSYETYNYPSSGVGKRVDAVGPPHNGIPTPHVVSTSKHANPKDSTKFSFKETGTRPARPDEIPRR